ncbi:nucleotidyltransferase domain-containing protein [Ruoffia halotolerans]|nr:nucleotidyltransferase domain-containing protein [Ruoffia halotolerans]
MNFNKLWKEFTTLPEVVAIALGGSRVKQILEEKSDYDLYLL